MYQVIARKYRPQSFADVVGQEHVKTTLRNAITQNRIAHGYIFSGQRGTGKTTMARILARCLNCIHGPTAEPCGVCASCVEIAAGSAVDVIEVDAASNRGINEVRELRENVRYRPARDRYKIFIIDEAHQITNEAFNALLKTIEEPPSWAVFILCTTESHKIPQTIVSRCQHFSFRSVDFEELVERLRLICREEGVEADEEALAVLAQSGEGSVRDSLSALDQAIACAGGRLEAADVRSLLGAFSLDAFSRISSGLVEQDGNRMLDLVDELERNGQNLQHFARELSRYFRNVLVAKISGEETRLIAASSRERAELVRIAAGFSEEDLTRYLQMALDLYRDLQFSLQPRFHLEIGLLKLVHAGRLVSIEKALANLGTGQPSAPVQAKPAEKIVPPSVSAATASPQRRGPSPFELDKLKKSMARDPQASAAGPRLVGASVGANALAAEPIRELESVPERAPEDALPAELSAQPEIDWKTRLLQGLQVLGLTFTADAVAHAEIAVNGGEVSFTVPQEFKLMISVDELQKAAKQQSLGPVRFKLLYSDAAAAPAPPADRAVHEDEVTKRALAHPEVQRFRELFGGEVRTVRNLKE